MATVAFREVPELHQHPADIVVAGVICGRVVQTLTDGYRADLVLHTANGEERMSGYGAGRMSAYIDARRRLREEAQSVLDTLDATEDAAPAYGAAFAQDQPVVSPAIASDETQGSAAEWGAEYCALLSRLNLDAESDRWINWDAVYTAGRPDEWDRIEEALEEIEREAASKQQDALLADQSWERLRQRMVGVDTPEENPCAHLQRRPLNPVAPSQRRYGARQHRETKDL